jgi:hypothetical protein
MSWQTFKANEAVALQATEDKVKRNRRYAVVCALLGARLVWPRELCVGDSPVGRMAFRTGSEFKADNMRYEQQFMDGKIKRLWRWKVAYWQEYRKVVNYVTDHIQIKRGEKMEDKLRDLIEKMGLEL